ncbi:hypothetical protein AB7M25_001429 [Pseudomonas sp. AP3_22 TE3818]
MLTRALWVTDASLVTRSHWRPEWNISNNGTAPHAKTHSQIIERLNNRRFTVAGNTHGLSCVGSVFHYKVEGNAISSTYQGGRIRTGLQVGRVTGPDTIELLFHCITNEGEILAGWSRGTVGVDEAGRTDAGVYGIGCRVRRVVGSRVMWRF